MKLIPAIDIINGQCVRLTQGDYEQKKVYNPKPLEVALSFENAGLKHLHLVDLDGAKAGLVTNWKVVEDITFSTRMHVDFGGGIKTEKEIARLLSLGVKQVNIGSVAVKQPNLVKEWLQKFGPERIILSADVKDEQIKINGWQEDASKTIYELIDDLHPAGLKYVTCTDISVDGMLTGPSIKLYQKLIARYPDIQWIASGGISSIEDIIHLKNINVYGAIIGKAIYENKISLKELDQTKY